MRSIDFIYDLASSDIGMRLQTRGKAYIVVCQENDRHFFGKGTVEVVKQLAKRGLALDGNVTGEDSFGDLINLIAKFDPEIVKYL